MQCKCQEFFTIAEWWEAERRSFAELTNTLNGTCPTHCCCTTDISSVHKSSELPHRINTDSRHIENTLFWPQSKAALHVSFRLSNSKMHCNEFSRMKKCPRRQRESHPSHFMCFCHLVSLNAFAMFTLILIL